jgi:hypothetical protein
MTIRYPRLPLNWKDAEEHLYRISQAINGLLKGQMSNTFDVTLTAGETTTTIVDGIIHAASCPTASPKTASAAAALTSLYFIANKGSLVIHHDSDPATDRTFCIAVFG